MLPQSVILDQTGHYAGNKLLQLSQYYNPMKKIFTLFV
jgi:hypothetical protein